MLFGTGHPGVSMSFVMRGTVNVPLDLRLNWETMTFGYAYRANPLVSFALNLHRHLFTFDLGGNVNIDMLGRVSVNQPVPNGPGISIDQPIDYSSAKLNGGAEGHYKAEVWSPTLGLQLWRFTLTSRFGVKTRAKGSLYAHYAVPFFIDPESFALPRDIKSLVLDSDNRGKLMSSAVVDMTYFSDSTSYLEWRMPDGHTISFDILPERLNISYTKFIGDIGMKMSGIHRQKTGESVDTTDIGFDVGVSIDNMIMLSGKFPNFFFNMGVFGFDVSSGDRKHLLGNAVSSGTGWPRIGNSMMLPVLNAGSYMGTKTQILLELDILPLPALKTGVAYYF